MYEITHFHGGARSIDPAPNDKSSVQTEDQFFVEAEDMPSINGTHDFLLWPNFLRTSTILWLHFSNKQTNRQTDRRIELDKDLIRT